MKFYVMNFGTVGTNLSVGIGETPTKYKGYRWNASAGSHQIHCQRRIWKKERDELGNQVSEYQVYDRKPATWPKESVRREITREEYINETLARTSKSQGSYYDGVKTRHWLLEELDWIQTNHG